MYPWGILQPQMWLIPRHKGPKIIMPQLKDIETIKIKWHALGVQWKRIKQERVKTTSTVCDCTKKYLVYEKVIIANTLQQFSIEDYFSQQWVRIVRYRIEVKYCCLGKYMFIWKTSQTWANRYCPACLLAFPRQWQKQHFWKYRIFRNIENSSWQM